MSEDNEGYKPFGCRYYFDGHWWTFCIYAKSFEEAEERVKRLSNSKVDGIIIATVNSRYKWLADIYIFFLRKWIKLKSLLNRKRDD